MVKLCLMASQGYLPGFVFTPERRLSQECQQLLFSPESAQDLAQPGFLAMRPLGLNRFEHPLSHKSGLLGSNQFDSIDSSVSRPVLIDLQDTRPNSVLSSFGIAKQCTKQGEILEFLSAGSSEVEGGGLNLSILTHLMGLQALPTENSPHSYAPDYGFCVRGAECQPTLFYPSNDFYSENPLLDFVGNLANKSEIMVHLKNQDAFSSTQNEMKDIQSIMAEFYLSKYSTKLRKQSLLVPQFDRRMFRKARDNIHESLKLEPLNVAPLKSPPKTRLRSSPKKKSNRNAGTERELHGKNYFYSCESLLSIIVDKKRHGKTAILELKKSGPELSQLLTQVAASIAGTGIALLFSVICKVAAGRVPFCASKLLNTTLGLGLVWLSLAVNSLRVMIMKISKNSGNWPLKEEDMMINLDRSVKEITFRAATLMAVMVLRLA